MALQHNTSYIVPLKVSLVKRLISVRLVKKSCISGNENTLGVLYISYSVVDDQRHK